MTPKQGKGGVSSLGSIFDDQKRFSVIYEYVRMISIITSERVRRHVRVIAFRYGKSSAKLWRLYGRLNVPVTCETQKTGTTKIFNVAYAREDG